MARINLEQMYEIQKQKYPSLYDTPSENWESFLNHTFLVNGTGEHWYNGGVYGDDTIGRRADRIADRRQWKRIEEYDVDRFIENSKINFSDNKRRIVLFAEHIRFPMKRIARVMQHTFYHWYPICRYANLLLIPKHNVNKTFLYGALETAFKVFITPTAQEIDFHWRPKQTDNQAVKNWIAPNKRIVVAFLAQMVEQRPKLIRKFLFEFGERK